MLSTTRMLFAQGSPMQGMKQPTQQQNRQELQDRPEVWPTFVTAPVQNKEGVARPVIEDVSCQSQRACCPHWLLFLQQDGRRLQHPGACCCPSISLRLRPGQERSFGSKIC